MLWMLVLFVSGDWLVSSTVFFCVLLSALVSVISFYIGADQTEPYGYICGVIFFFFAGLQIGWFCEVNHRIHLTATLIEVSVQHLSETYGVILCSIGFTAVCIGFVLWVVWSLVHARLVLLTARRCST